MVETERHPKAEEVVPTEPSYAIPRAIFLAGLLGVEEVMINGFGLGTLVTMAAGSF